MTTENTDLAFDSLRDDLGGFAAPDLGMRRDDADVQRHGLGHILLHLCPLLFDVGDSANVEECLLSDVVELCLLYTSRCV